MRKILAALSALVFLSMPVMALATEWKDGNTPSNGVAPSGQQAVGWDGSSNRALKTDADGNLYTRLIVPGMVTIAHKTNIALASATVDTSSVPVQVNQYRQLYGILRVKEASLAATAAIEVSIKGCLTAQTDSTALGWWFPLGLGDRDGKTIYTASQTDRWKMIAIVDSLNGTPFQAPYAAFAITNRTGAQIKYDFWILGVPW